MSYENLEAPRFHATATTAWADQISENFDYLWTDRPSVSLVKSSDTTCPPDEQTTIEWTDAQWEVGDWWTSGEAVFAPREGIYFISVDVDWQAETEGVRTICVFQNYQGDPQSLWDLPLLWSSASPEQTTGYCTQNMSGIVYLSQGDALVTAISRNLEDWDDAPTIVANGDRQRFQALWIGGYENAL